MHRFQKLIIIIIIILLLPAIFIHFPSFNLQEQRDTTDQLIKKHDIKTVLVFGAGIKNNYPTIVLQARLDKAAEVFYKYQLNNILVSGDNKTKDYNEPDAMKQYLVSIWKIPEKNIIADYGGRRTLDSCWRAKNVFSISKTIIITQAFHLARANYLCQEVGIDTVVPIIARNSTFGSTVTSVIREVLATWQAIGDSILNKEALIKGNGLETPIE
jgi:vancomycin permeability regulator SanA